MRVRANILWAPGTNCHHETAYAFKLAGAKPRIVLLNRLLSAKEKLYDCDLFAVPGGFSWGDHIRAGVIAAIDLAYCLRDQLMVVLERKIPVLGICNGFQILANAGLFDDAKTPTVVLDMNESALFEHWSRTKIVLHHVEGSVWTQGLDGTEMRLPVAHAEGRPLDFSKGEEDKWKIAATYGTWQGDSSYPVSPNGSQIAGICKEHIMGLMPHPERRVDSIRGQDGLAIFKAGVNAVK